MNNYDDDLDQYLVHDEEREEAFRKPSFSLVKSNDNIRTHKTKLSSEAHKNSVKKSQFIKLEENCSVPSLHSVDKRERNRMAAKQSRDRKKLYIELMEYEQKKLERQLNFITKEIGQTKQKINKFCSQNKTILGLCTRNQLESKLEHILHTKHTSSTDQELTLVLDSLMFRVGATGRERMQKQNECFKQIINLSLPALHRYLLWTATQSKHIFNMGKNQTDEYDQFLCKLPVAIDDSDQTVEKLQEVKEVIASRKQNLVNLITKLWQTKVNIQTVTKNIESEIYSIMDSLTPVQTAKLTLFTKYYKYRRQLNFLEENILEAHIPQSHGRKRVKRQQQRRF